MQKLKSVGPDETLQQGILRAINLVAKYLGAHKEGDINVLKKQVHAAIAAGAGSTGKGSGCGGGTGVGSGGGRAGTGAGASASSTTNFGDFTTFGTTSRDGIGGRVGAKVRTADHMFSATAPAPAASAAAPRVKGQMEEADWSLPPIWIDRKAGKSL